MSAALILVTVIFGDPLNPVASPVTLPRNVVAVTTPVTFTPVAVIIPLVASRVIPVPTLTTLLNVAAVPVIMLSVDATPVSPVHLQRN